MDDRRPTGEDELETLTCTWHPDRETLLRCNRCSRPMCTACAVKHPVGLRCKACVREMRSPLYVVSARQYVTAGVAGLAAGTLAALFMSLIGGFWLVAVFIGAGLGTAVAEAVSVAAGRKRGRGLQIVTVASMVLGVGAAGALIAFTPLGSLAPFRAAGVFNIGVLIYLAVGVSAAASRLR